MDEPDSPPLEQIRSLFGDWAAPIVATECENISTDIAKDLVGSFDAVMCMAVLHVLSREQSLQILTRLCRVLRVPGGISKIHHR